MIAGIKQGGASTVPVAAQRGSYVIGTADGIMN
jgi:hypothetical protein